MHSEARTHCMDYIVSHFFFECQFMKLIFYFEYDKAKNKDYFKQYITEDVERYVSRKRVDTCHGNHIEIIALAEIYQRPVEVYEYSTGKCFK